MSHSELSPELKEKSSLNGSARPIQLNCLDSNNKDFKSDSKSPTTTKEETTSPSATSLKLNPFQLLSRYQAGATEDNTDFSPISSFPEFYLPQGDDLDTLSIVNSLKQKMKYEGLSQTKVARFLGKGQATVSQILNNPKPWAMLTERGKDTYRLLKLWLDQQMLTEAEEGSTASYDEQIQKLSSVTGLPHEQVQRWLQIYRSDPSSPLHNGLLSDSLKSDYDTHSSPLFRESPKNDMLLDLTRIRLKEEDIIDLFKKAPDCEATDICTQYAERVNLWIARGNFLSTEDISGEVRREIEKHSISQGMFSQKILRRKQATLSEALCHPKPWGRLSDRGKLIYCFMKLWLLLPDDRRLAPFKEESLQRFRQIPTQAIPVLDHEFKLYKGAPPKMVKEKLAEDLGLEYCTVTNYFSHCPSSTNAFKHDTGLSVPFSSLPTMVKYPSPMDSLHHSFSKPDFHSQLPPLSPMGRLGGLAPLHLGALSHASDLQNCVSRSKASFMRPDSSKDIDTFKLVADLRNRFRLLNISQHTFIECVLLRKHSGTMVALNDLLMHPRPFSLLNSHQKEVFLTISEWIEQPMHEQLASINPLAQRAFKPFEPTLYSMELTELQFITTETKKFLKQYNLSQTRFAERVLLVRPEALQELLSNNPQPWAHLPAQHKSIFHMLKEWVNDKGLQEKLAMFYDTQDSSRSPSLTSPKAGSSRSTPCSNSIDTSSFLSSPFIMPNSRAKAGMPLITSSTSLIKSPTTLISTSASSTSTPAFPSPEERSTAISSSGDARSPTATTPLQSRSPMDISPKNGEEGTTTNTQTEGPTPEPVSHVCYGDNNRSIGSQKWPEECCHEALQCMLKHVRETSSRNIMLCNHLEQVYKHLIPFKRDRSWPSTSPLADTDLENPMKRIRMSSPNS